MISVSNSSFSLAQTHINTHTFRMSLSLRVLSLLIFDELISSSNAFKMFNKLRLRYHVSRYEIFQKFGFLLHQFSFPAFFDDTTNDSNTPLMVVQLPVVAKRPFDRLEYSTFGMTKRSEGTVGYRRPLSIIDLVRQLERDY